MSYSQKKPFVVLYVYPWKGGEFIKSSSLTFHCLFKFCYSKILNLMYKGYVETLTSNYKQAKLRKLARKLTFLAKYYFLYHIHSIEFLNMTP